MSGTVSVAGDLVAFVCAFPESPIMTNSRCAGCVDAYHR
jgi:hypothetical protein